MPKLNDDWEMPEKAEVTGMQELWQRKGTYCSEPNQPC